MNFVNGDQNYFTPFKKHEYILNNKNESFENKIESLIDVWKSVGELNLSQFDLRHVIQIMDWAKLHALNIVLTAEWNGFKATYQSKLLDEIEKAQTELLKLNSAFATRCKKLADVVRNPWEDPTLMKLMKTNNAEIGPEEIEYFCVETAYLVSVRLKKLCESHCEDLALNLVTAFMNCNKLSKTQNFSLNATETQMWFIFDIYIALLYKFQEKQKIVVLLKELTFDEGLQLVKRFAKKRVKISKIWKNCQRVAILAVQMYISQAAVKYADELKEFLESYLEIYISLCNTEALLQDFSTSIRRISNLADAAGLYVFCDVIQRKAGAKLKPFVIEMYIRALTTDMNELERQKDSNESEKAALTTSRLAAAFCNLADFLDEHVKVARECVLTAFSLEPTKERLENIETLAKRSGFVVLDTGQEWKCKLHPPTLPSDEITWMCPECGEWRSKPEFNVPIKINMALNEALQNSILGISEALCDDLVVCLSNPRYQILSWFLPWEELHRHCLMYLQDPQATKNIVTELKFVDIDYSIFKGIKREPLDELEGIERGYEQYLDQDFVSDEETSSNSEDSMSQDSRPYSLGSDGAGEGPYLPMLPAQTKSDPNTLKSLRMFRPSLKRAKEKEGGEGTPEKLFKADANNTKIAHTVTSGSVDTPKAEAKPATSLNQFLNKITPKYSAIQYPKPYVIPSSSMSSTCDNDFDSKNVKTATLPLLGGQVAKKENTLIQVNNKHLNNSPQERKTPSLSKHQSHNPTKTEPTKKDLKSRIQNKSLRNGLKGKTFSKIQDFRLPSPDLKVYKNPLKSTKNLNSAPVIEVQPTEFRQMHPVINQDTPKLELTQSAQQLHSTQEQRSSPQPFKTSPSPQQNTPQPPPLVSQSQSPEQPPTPQAKNSSQPQNINQPPMSVSPNQPHILNKSASNQNQSHKESCNQQAPSLKQEQPEKIQVSQLHPRVKEILVPLLQEAVANLNNPPVVSPQQKSSTPSSNLTQQLQTEASKSENHPPNCVPNLTQLLNLNQAPNASQLLIRLIKVDRVPTSPEQQDQNPSIKQEQTHCTVISQHLVTPVSSQENLQNSSYQCRNLNPLNQNPLQQQKISISPSRVTLPNLILQIPGAKQLNHTNEAQVKKLLESCSSQYLKKEPQERDQTQNSQVKQGQHSLIAVVTPLQLNKMCPLSAPLTPNTNITQPTMPPTSNSSLQSPASPKLNNTSPLLIPVQQNSSSQVPTLPKSDNPSVSTHPSSNNKTSLVQTVRQTKPVSQLQPPLKSNKTSRAPTPTPIANKSPVPTSYNLDSKVTPASTLSKSNSMCQTLTTPLSSNRKASRVPMLLMQNHQASQFLSTKKPVIKQETSQTSCFGLAANSPNQEQPTKVPLNQLSNSMPLLNPIQEQKASDSMDKPQCNLPIKLPVQSSILLPCSQQQEQKQMISKEKPQQCTPNVQQQPQPQLNNHQISQPVKVLNQNKIKEERPLTNKSSSHNNFCSSPKVPSLYPNLDKLPISPVNPVSPQTSNHKAAERTEAVDLNKNKCTQQSHKTATQLFQKHPSTEIKNSLDKELSTELSKVLSKEVSKAPALVNQDKRSAKLAQQADPTTNKQVLFNKQQINNIKMSLELIKANPRQVCPKQKNFCNSSDITPSKNDSCDKGKLICIPDNSISSELLDLIKNKLAQQSLKVPPPTEQRPEILKLTNSISAELVDLIKSKITQQTKKVSVQTEQKSSGSDVQNLINLKKELRKDPMLPKKDNQPNKLELITKNKYLVPKQEESNGGSTNQNRIYARPNDCGISDVPSENDSCNSADLIGKLNEPLKCNNGSISMANANATSKSNNVEGNNNNEEIEDLNSKQIAQFNSDWMDSGIFSDVSESHSEELSFQADFSALIKKEFLENNDPREILPKNIHLTENIRTYTKRSKRKILIDNKDCVKTLTGVDVLDDCKNVNNINSTEYLHSNVQNSLTNSKELKVILCRLSSSRRTEGKCTANKDEYHSIKQKCDRGKTPPKNSRRRKSLDKSENKVGKAPSLVQNHNLSPLQDVNLRVNSQINSKACCDFNKPNPLEETKTDRSLSEKNPDKKAFLKSVLSNVPGLNDFQMIRPTSVNPVVNVVQVSGGRATQSVSIQNSQTSTQVTPHIQRIGQPRVSDQKPEHSNSITSTTQTSSTTSATSRTTTSQPSTLINILSQQVIRPVSNQTNALRRQGPYILSQQFIRPATALTPKTVVNSAPSSEANQVKVSVSSEPTILNSTIKTTNSVVKAPTTVTTGQGGTILQFICKSSLPKFQQAFGKTVYQNSTEAADSPTTTTTEITNSTSTETKKATVTTKTVPVSVQPIQGSVIYSRQVPVGQTISLIPPGGTTRQVFRIATSNPEQISLVKDSVIHSKMSALLAAALQGRPKNADGEIQVNCEEVKGTITRPTLVQSARIVKPVQLQLPTNVVRANPQQPNMSSTTLEQLREFDMVYKQIKERSNTSTSETSTNSGESQEVAPQRISVTYVNQLQKYTQLSPVVVVTSYNNLQPAASPALSVTSQGSSSPCVTPASTPTLPKIATKTSKGKTLKTTPNNTATKSSPIPKPQQKPQEDEHTTQRIFDILAEYAEQLRNSPDLNNKPAPRRRSNPPTNPNQNSKRKKNSSGVKKSGQSSSTLEMDTDDMTIGSEDSSGGGVVQLSVTDDEQSQASAPVNTQEANDNANPPTARPVILAEGGTCTNQSRNLIIADSNVGEALKMPNTAVIVPGSYIMPVSMVKVFNVVFICVYRDITY